MADSRVEYGFTNRNFTTAKIEEADIPVLIVQASSTASYLYAPSASLKESDGSPMPGASALWLKEVRPCGEQGAAIHLNREQVAILAGILLRWLATGFIQKEG